MVRDFRLRTVRPLIPLASLPEATKSPFQRGATERPSWNERLYLAQIIRLRLRRAGKYESRLQRPHDAVLGGGLHFALWRADTPRINVRVAIADSKGEPGRPCVPVGSETEVGDGPPAFGRGMSTIVEWHERIDRLSEWLILFTVIFAPWAFGCTQPWAIWTMNTAGYALGGLLLGKRLIRILTGYRPMRWGEQIPGPGEPAVYRPHALAARWLSRSLAGLNFLLLVYTLISAINYRSEIHNGVQEFNDRYVPWLPFSYDSSSTWSAFWMYLGLTGFFWATRDWLLGKSERERSYGDHAEVSVLPLTISGLPDRLSRLLWVLCLNGTLLAAVSIVQRLDGTDKLLWLVLPRYGDASFHFGPFTYRGNAAQYFNLLWPVAMAFWWTLFRSAQSRERAPTRIGGNPHWVLLPCVLVQIASPIISGSRGGSVIVLVVATGALLVLVIGNWRASLAVRIGILVPLVIALGLVGYLGWNQYKAGMVNAFTDDLGDRLEIYQNARLMSVQHPLFGTGPGTFADVYSLYRSDITDVSAAYAHNDWLQTKITFGWVGFAIVLLMLVHPFVRWWIPEGIPCRWDVTTMFWLAMAGCLFHARYDFPFQVLSTLHLFLLYCCICMCLARKA